ncbi:MAG: WD40 repeat domain-containing protein, partial [Candidatus Acidiferrales bacterium]
MRLLQREVNLHLSIDRLRGFLLILFFCSAISRSVCAQDQRPELFLQLPHQGEVLDADFSPKGGYATAGQDGTVRIWSGESGLLSAILEAHPHGAMACRFDPSGNFLATGGVDGHVKIWETGNYRLVRDLATKHEIHSVEWSGDGKILAALDVLEEAFLWDASSGSLLLGNGNPVIYEKDHPDHQVYPFYDLRHHLAFAPDNEHLLVAKREGYALEVVAPPGSPAWNIPPIFPASINSSPNANRIAITGMSNFLVYDGALSKVIARMNHGTSASPLRLSRDGKFAFYTDQNFAYVLDTENLTVVFSTSMKQEFTQGVWKFTAAAISPNSQSILLANDQGDFRIYRIASGQMVRQ